MAIIVNNESNMQGDPTEDAIRQALAGMDLASVQDSLTASRYAVSSVDQANVPTLVGAQIGGNSGTQGGTGQNIIGQDSVVAETQGNLTIIKLVSDQGGGGLPGNTYYYGTDPTGVKGFFTVASTMAVASTSRMTQTVGADGVSTFDLATVTDAGGGSLLKFVRDAWGRITGTSTPTTTDLAEGSNLYFTAARVLATVLVGLSTATNAVITAADTVLSAMGKLQAQISANVTALAGKLSASANLSDVANASTSLSNLGGMPIAGGTFTGTVAIQPPGATSNLNLCASASGQQNRITGFVGGNLVSNRRWLLQYGDGTPETGSNSGSNYTLFGADDNGALIADYMQIIRSTGDCNLAGNLSPFVDNSKSCGVAAQRWSVIYAATGTINTSDAREKTEVAPLTSNEIAAAADMARAIGTYQWLASTADKGADKARHHVGLTVQRAIEIMQAHGLDPMRYGFICYDQWDATPEVWVDVPAQVDADGNETAPASRVLNEAARGAGDRYSFRPDELQFFLARGFAARLDALEAKTA